METTTQVCLISFAFIAGFVMGNGLWGHEWVGTISTETGTMVVQEGKCYLTEDDGFVEIYCK